jgi:hypothetical protein
VIRLTFTIVLLAIFVGCSGSSTAPTGPATPAGFPGYVRPDVAALAAEDAKAISIAKAHLEKTVGKTVDAYYKVTKTDAGFSVHVEYVTGYDENSQPLFITGGHCTVLVSSDGNVVTTLPGA